MKKLLCLLTILLGLTGAARAETLFTPESGDAFRTLCASGDTLWVRGAQETVYRVDAQTGETALVSSSRPLNGSSSSSARQGYSTARTMAARRLMPPL